MSVLDYFDQSLNAHIVTADAQVGDTVIEGYEVIHNGNIKDVVTASASQENRKMIKQGILDSNDWLPFAAEKYNISASIKDYVLIPVPIMYSDFPNRNMVGFPFKELTAFNPNAGMLAYNTWKGKPTFYEHNNKDYTKALGVVLDVAMRPTSLFKGNPWRLMTLLAFDRTRDPSLTDKIIAKTSNAYSMGASCMSFSCSICGAVLRSPRQLRCDHVDMSRPIQMASFNNKLAYRCAQDITGFEVSAVGTPAFPQAVSYRFD